MTYRTIAVHVNGSRHTPDRIRLAARIACAHEAHLIGMATSTLPSALYISGNTTEGAAALSAYLNSIEQRAAGALAAFEAVAQQAGVPSSEKRLIDDDAGAALCLQGRYADLLVVSQDDPDESLPGEFATLPEYVVMHSGRPVLLVPHTGTFDAFGRRILIAWDGSLEATRAVSGALPLLRNAQLVQAVVFDATSVPNAHGEEPGADLGLYLARHGVNVEVVQRSTEGGIDVGEALLSCAAAFGADLLVMGAYGHSRMREILLGGTTRTMLRSMNVPVLMSH